MSLKPNSLEELWMPFTANKHFKQEPRLFVEAKGVYLKKVSVSRTMGVGVRIDQSGMAGATAQAAG